MYKKISVGTTTQVGGGRAILSLFDLIDRILERGMVIDINLSISLVCIEILVIRAWIVIASVDSFLRYAAAMGLAGAPGIVLSEED